MSWKGNWNLSLSKEATEMEEKIRSDFLEFQYEAETKEDYNKAKLYQLAIVLGIRSNDPKDLGSEKEVFTKLSNIAPNDDFFEALMEILHPEKTEKERFRMLQKYAERGFREIDSNYEQTGQIEYPEIVGDVNELNLSDRVEEYIDQIP